MRHVDLITRPKGQDRPSARTLGKLPSFSNILYGKTLSF
jgi:hypothetical protein